MPVGGGTPEFPYGEINDCAKFTLVDLGPGNSHFELVHPLNGAEMTIEQYERVVEHGGFYLEKYVVYRKRKIYVGEKNLMDLEPMFNKFKNDKFLLPSSDILNPDTIEFLNDININWKRAQLFKTVTSDLSDLRDVYYDILVFFSPSGIESLFKNFPDFKQNDTKIAVFGNTTVEAADNANLRIDIKAPTKESPSMTMAIEKYIQKLN